MKRLLVATLSLLLAFAGLTALAPVAHAGTQCKSTASFEDLFSFQDDDSIRIDFDALAGRTEATHGGFIPHCGEPCDVEGGGGGCITYRYGAPAKTTCTCTSGKWVCD